MLFSRYRPLPLYSQPQHSWHPLNNLWKLSVHNVSVSTLNDWQGNIIAESINDAHFAREQGKSVNWLHK